MPHPSCRAASLLCPALGALALLVGVSAADRPVLGQPPQPHAPALPPLLYVRVAEPAGMRVTFYRGGAAGKTLEAPFTVGLRAGYIYRVEVSGIPGQGNLVLHPTLEVRGTLLVPSKMGRDHPAPLNLTGPDFTAVRGGALVTRVVTVERPDNPIPVATRADRPLEFYVPPDRDPTQEALQHGRPLLVVRVGQRVLSQAELAQTGLPGTVLLPGEKVLPAPPVPPWVPWTCAPVSDPKLGPYPPGAEICFHDGGDIGLRAGHGRDGQLRGVDPSDSVAEYTDSAGQRRVAVSNRICLCVPRYVVTRGEVAPQGNRAQVPPFQATVAEGQSALVGRSLVLEHHGRETPLELAGRLRASEVLNLEGAAVVYRVEGLSVTSGAEDTRSVSGTCPRPEIPKLGRPLKLIKWPDRCDAKIGEVVTFFLKYTNYGELPINDVAVTDSLTTRLEYVPGSARSDRDSTFTTQPNEAGSQTLRWDITGSLPPGQSGVVSFQARIR